jgi:membrane protease YdiL (CAAX protease family)
MDNRAAVLGFQVTFLAFAVVLLNAPLEKYLYSQWQWARDLELDLGRALMVASGGVLLIGIAPLRRLAAEMLAPRIPRGRIPEVALAVAMNWLVTMGALGAMALTLFVIGGEARLGAAMGDDVAHPVRLGEALRPSHLVTFVFVAGLIGPIVEELVFRGFLYQAWRQAWGWVWAAIASAAVFGLFHGIVVPQLLSGIVMVVAMRRSGSMRTNIYAHALFNLLAWYPLLGQFVLPADRSTGDLQAWWFHLACLGATIVALPIYMGSARDARLPRRTDDFAPAAMS